MRDSMVRTTLVSMAAALCLAACSDSLAIRDNLEKQIEENREKEAYAAATYTVTLESAFGGTVNIDVASVHNEEALQITAVPSRQWLFSGWTVVAGEATIADPYSESTNVFVVGNDATIRADFITPKPRSWNAIASSDSGQYLYAAEDRGQVYASSNYGATWRLLRGSPSANSFVSIACDASGQHVVGAGGGSLGLFVSSDYGATWTPGDPALPAGSASWNWIDVALDDAGRRIVAANNNGSIYTSADLGATWEQRDADNGLPSSEELWSSVASDSSGMIISAAVYGGNAYFSTDGGATWSLLYDFGSHYDSVYLSENADGTRFQIACGYNTIYATDTHTRGWYTSTGAYGWTGIDCDRTGQYIITARYGYQIFTSELWGNGDYVPHSGQSDGLPDSGSTNAYWTGVCCDGTGARMAAAANGNYIYVSQDRGQTWNAAL